MNHMIRMLIGCLVPLALIFILPLFGVGSGVTLLVFIVLMFFCHIMMMGGHDHGDHRPHDPHGENIPGEHIHQSKEKKDE